LIHTLFHTLCNIAFLRFIWWILLGVLLMGFAVTDGFDFGVAALLPFVAHSEIERRTILNTIGPFWEGNQVWIILGAGTILAAWPLVYATAFSCFYWLIFMLLLTMGISRPVSFKYRSKLPNLFWRRFWDHVIFLGGVIPGLLFGILIGNVLCGIPFYLDPSLRVFYTGNVGDFFHPFALFCGLTSLSMLTMHGSLYLMMKTEGAIYQRSLTASRWMSIVFMLCFVLTCLWAAYALSGYQIIGFMDPKGVSNPLHKHVMVQIGAWRHHNVLFPANWLAPLITCVGAMSVCFLSYLKQNRLAFLCSGLAIMSTIASVGLNMFPFILPSSTHPASSLLVWDASSSTGTLLLMLIVAVFFLPIILLYTSWVYYVLRGKVTGETIAQNKQAY